MSKQKSAIKIKIVWIYQDLLNLYGDRGNILTLTYRARARGIHVHTLGVSLGQSIPADTNLIFLGGGQDQEQNLVSDDLQKKAPFLKKFIESGGPLLSICGGYQLLGSYYQTRQGEKIKGADVLPIYTKASHERMIGDLEINAQINNKPVKLIGFENHSGKTFLTNAEPLGKVTIGFGNNGEDHTAGIKYHNAIGTYLHGPLLPKNPKLADFLIAKALLYQGLDRELAPLDQELDTKIVPLARQQAMDRARHRKKSGHGLRS